MQIDFGSPNRREAMRAGAAALFAPFLAKLSTALPTPPDLSPHGLIETGIWVRDTLLEKGLREVLLPAGPEDAKKTLVAWNHCEARFADVFEPPAVDTALALELEMVETDAEIQSPKDIDKLIADNDPEFLADVEKCNRLPFLFGDDLTVDPDIAFSSVRFTRITFHQDEIVRNWVWDSPHFSEGKDCILSSLRSWVEIVKRLDDKELEELQTALEEKRVVNLECYRDRFEQELLEELRPLLRPIPAQFSDSGFNWHELSGHRQYLFGDDIAERRADLRQKLQGLTQARF